MTFAHLTLPTRDVPATVAFLEHAMGWPRIHVPDNTPIETAWLDIGRGQQVHVFHVEGFQTSDFEREFGRHIALFHPGSDFDALRKRLMDHGAELIPPIRPTPFQRFFFREPVNGYVFEVIDEDHFVKE